MKNFRNREQEIEYYKNLDPKKKDKRQAKTVRQARKRSAQAARFVQRRKKNEK